jgi:uracil-DNA glycosylase
MELNNLAKTIIACKTCPRLVAFRSKIANDKRKSFKKWDYWGKPVPGYGDINSKMMILGLAPAAHGGNRTGRVFTGDKSADFLFKCLYHVGLSNQSNSDHRNDGLKLKGYITAAVKCVPPGDKPTAEEKSNCEPFLEQEFKILNKVKIVLGLGKIGFESFLKLIRKKYPIKMKDYNFGHGVKYQFPNKIYLIGSYHPSPRNVNTGKLTFDMMTKLLKDIQKEL